MSPSKRLKYRDYSSHGLYFVTICANYKRCIFGEVSAGHVKLSAVGRIAHETWMTIPLHFCNVNLHAFAVMPNHIHGIVEITESRLAQHPASLRHTSRVTDQGVRPASLSAIVRSYKAEVTRRARLELNWKEETWQHNYFDRVIRDGREFAAATSYIAENPLHWEREKDNLQALQQIRGTRLAQRAAPLQGRTRS